MAKKKTTDEFKKEVYKQVGNEYTVLGEYINSSKNILIRHNCKNCNNYEWEVNPSKFITDNRRCPKCNRLNRKKTHKDFVNEVYSLVKNEYTVLGNYINTDTKIKIRHNCKNCNNYEYMVTPHMFLQGYRCPKCFSTPRKTTEEFKQEIKNITENEYTVLGEYINNKTKILMRHNCEDCNNYEYMVRPNDFLQGYRCPKCADSNGNKYIYKYLENHNINFIDEKSFDTCKYINVLSFDFYIPNMNLLIEYDGKQHFDLKYSFGSSTPEKNFNLQLKRDQIKNKWSENNNVKLIRIGYKDYYKLEEILNEIFLTNDFDPNNYNSIYMYIPNTKILYESGMYKEIPEIDESLL